MSMMIILIALIAVIILVILITPCRLLVDGPPVFISQTASHGITVLHTLSSGVKRGIMTPMTL